MTNVFSAPLASFSQTAIIAMTPQQCPACTPMASGCVVAAPSTNLATVYIGGQGLAVGAGYPLNPGDKMSLSIANFNQLWFYAANTTDVITGLGI